MTPIEVEAYTDDYGNRLALRYPYSPETNTILKNALPFPQFMWDKNNRAWSVQDDALTINRAVEILERMDYDCRGLIGRTKELPKNVRGASECWTRLSEGLLYLHWPYIPDNAFRDKVRLIVRQGTEVLVDSSSTSAYITLFVRGCVPMLSRRYRRQ